MNFLRKLKEFFFPEKEEQVAWPFPTVSEEAPKKKRGRPRKSAITPQPTKKTKKVK